MVREHIVIRNSLEGVNREPLTSYLMHAYCYDGECCFSFNNNRYTMYAGDCMITRRGDLIDCIAAIATANHAARLVSVPSYCIAMDEMPSKQQLILLVNSLCKLQDKILSVKGMPKHIQQPIADKVEPLKAPMFFLWEKLGYGIPNELSARGINGYWMASFHTSPPDFLSECIQQLRSFEIPINEYDGGIDLQKSLINFYSDLQEMYEI